MAMTVLVSQVGGPEVMQLVDLDPGAPGPRQIRIRQTAIGVNFGDVQKRRGAAPPHAMAAITFPFTPGLEAAGVVEAVGPGVTRFSPGDRVCYAVASMLGGYAEVRLFDADKACRLPDGVSDIDAAGLLYKGVTVQGLIRSCHRIRAGEIVLLHAAAGGVGSVFSRWAKHLGAVVIGAVSTEAKAERARDQGCDHVIVTGQQDFVARTLEITGGRGVDVVYDSIGADVFTRSFDCLRRYGTMVSFGQSAGAMPLIDPVMLQHNGHYLTKFSGSTYNADPAEYAQRIEEVLAAIGQGVLSGLTHAIYPLAEAVRAHTDFEARRTSGSIVMVA
ncbi:MAG: quinone oxidoreductase [Phenylobacterium sp.]|nr:quinone oxidoreductase [Phenylobacterium sp.]